MENVQFGKKIDRWNRIFGSDDRTLIVALDHIPDGLMAGWEHPEETLHKVLEGNPDALVLNFGILKRFAPLLTENVSVILRMDGGPSYLLEKWPSVTRWKGLYSVEDAVSVGADAVIVNVLIGNKLEIDCLQIAAGIAGDCFRHGMPCAFQSLPVGPGISDSLDPELLSFSCRMAAEFGADFVETYYSGDPRSFRRVTSRCPVPVLTATSGKLDSDRSLLHYVKGMLEGGGKGVVIGRKVWQHPNPAAVIRALGRLIHEDANVDTALEELN